MQNKADSELLRKKRCERLHGLTCVNSAVPGCVSRPLCKMAKNASNQENGVTKKTSPLKLLSQHNRMQRSFGLCATNPTRYAHRSVTQYLNIQKNKRKEMHIINWNLPDGFVHAPAHKQATVVHYTPSHISTRQRMSVRITGVLDSVHHPEF
jgi:hypothetical protein